MLVKFYTKKKQLNKHHFIGKFIIKEDVCLLGDLITEICGVDYPQMKKKQRETIKSSEQVKCLHDPVPFVNTPKYSEDATSRICQFFSCLFKYMVGDPSEVESMWDNGSGSRSGSHRNPKKEKTNLSQILS